MSFLLRIVIVVVALIFSALSIGLLLRRRISEKSTLLWLTGTLVVLLLAVFPQTLNWVANRVGIDYPPSLLYLVAIMSLLLIVLYQSMQISRMDERLRKVGQVVALLGFDAQEGRQAPDAAGITQLVAQLQVAQNQAGVSSQSLDPGYRTLAASVPDAAYEKIPHELPDDGRQGQPSDKRAGVSPLTAKPTVGETVESR